MLWFFRVIAIIVGPLIGWFKISQDAMGIGIGFGAAIFIIFVEVMMERIPLSDMIYGGIGAILGLIFAWFINNAFIWVNEPHLSALLGKYSYLLYPIFIYLGMVLAVRREQEIEGMDSMTGLPRPGLRRNEPKILDTSAIIDGRVADVCNTKFLAGPLIVPKFVLKELQDIADSSDSSKRTRGRRGLEILAKLQEHPDYGVKVVEKDYANIPEVDAKLVQLARDLKGKLVTTDFNLNKVALLQGVIALNINDLANALKPVILPGEVMNVFLLKEGKEREQAVAYLDDGTMVVVEEGRRYMNRKFEVTVTSILQTSAGRMIFAKLVKEVNGHQNHPHPKE